MNDRVQIEVLRPGKTARVFDEGFVADDGVCLKTSSVVAPEHVEYLSGIFHQAGMIGLHDRIRRVDKFNFYREPFAIMRVHSSVRSPAESLLGYYCDVATPLERTPAGYRRTDLFLDLWIGAGGGSSVLDEDELEEALRSGVITAAEGRFARQALARMLAEVEKGVFPSRYVG